MKKLLAVIVAFAMVLSLSVAVFAEEVVYSMTTTGGQGMESLDVASGATFSGGDNNDNYGRIATSWVGGGTVYNELLAAIQTPDAVIRVTYTGTITKIGFQTNLGGYEMVDVTDVTEVDGKNVAIISCADIVAAAPDAISGDIGEWSNFMMDFTEGGQLFGFEVVTGYTAAAAEEPAAEEPDAEEPAAEEPAAEAPAEEPAAEAPAETATEAPAETTTTAPAETTSKAPSTGIALAVVPAVVALAAVAVSKKH